MAIASSDLGVVSYDLASQDLRTLNQRLHDLTPEQAKIPWRIEHPRGGHAIAAGVKVPVQIDILGHVGYYCGGMNQAARLTIHGLAGTGVAENMMSGEVRVKGHASQCAGASAHGGLLVIEGDASSRCGISMKGVDIVVHGSVGHMSCFMAQAGNLVVCGDADESLGDSLYEARIFVRGSVKSLGADCVEKPLEEKHRQILADLLERAQVLGAKPEQFRRYGSARKLYNFHVDHISMY
jgi:glutamate synthase domain-containing protein 3